MGMAASAAGGGSKGGSGAAPNVMGGSQNIYDQSSAAMGNAGNMFGAAASMYGAPGLTGPASTYNPSMMQAASAADPAKISAGIQGYMNPYQGQVIDRSIDSVNRLTQIQQGANGAAATNAGAFGGSRHGLVEAQTNEAAQRNIGDLSANLLNTGWNTAAQLSGQDIANSMGTNQFNASLLQGARGANQGAANTAGSFNAGQRQNWNLAKDASQQSRAGGLLAAGGATQGLGSMMFGMGNEITNQQMGAGSLQQQLVQSIMSGAQGQYGQFMQQPQNALNIALSALGMNPMQNATTTTGQYTPGMFDYLSLAAQTAGNFMGMKAAGS